MADAPVPRLAALDHVNIESTDVEASARFYADVLGLEAGARPAFSRDGFWMYLAGQPIVHIITPAADNAMLTGSKDAAISHFALRIDDYDAMRAHLDGHDVAYQEMNVPGTPMRQMFVQDPNGVLVELLHVPPGAR